VNPGEGAVLTCHIDGASRGNPGPAGAGVVVYDGSGRERRAAGIYLGETTNNVAEYLALIEALRAASDICREDGLERDRTSVVIRTDSQLVARQVSGEYRVKSQALAPLLGDFRREAGGFYRVSVLHVPREQNRRADELANQAIDDAFGRGKSGASPRYSRLSHLECSRCERRLDPAEPHGPCPACGAPLLARYDLAGLVWPPRGNDCSLGNPGQCPEHNSMWRYHELLPVTAPQYVVSLGEGLTPLVAMGGLERELGLGRVLVKDDRLNPTGTFKSRGASAAVSRLVELGIEKCAIPTQGNAGSAFAAYSARAGLRFLTAMPEDTPAAIRAECEAYGAEVVTVKGLLPDAGRYVRERAAAEGWYVASTFDEPYRAEGKKTIALELFEAFGSRWPDAIVFPVGGGVGLVGAWKAAQELATAGVAGAAEPRSGATGAAGPGSGASGTTDGRPRLPRLFAVQAAGCAPVVKAYGEGRDETEPFANAETVAAGLRVPSPKAGFLILRALRASGGAAVAVPDEVILRTVVKLRREEGLNFCPEGAAAVAALPELARRGWLDGCREVVVVSTGTGLKYPSG